MTDDEAKQLIANGVRAIAENRAADSGEAVPFVTAWIVGYEIDNMDLARDGEAAGGVIVPAGQSSHMSRGLAADAFDFWRPSI